MDKYFTWIFSRVIVCLHVAPGTQDSSMVEVLRARLSRLYVSSVGSGIKLLKHTVYVMGS